MITPVEQWLAYGDDLPVKLAEVVTPGPWKHEVEEIRRGAVPTPLKKCRKCGQCYPTRHSSCPVRDPIKLDWNTAMKWRDWCVKKYGATKLREAMSKVAMYQTSTEPATTHLQILFGANWFSVYAQPKDCLIAAAMAAERSKE